MNRDLPQNQLSHRHHSATYIDELIKKLISSLVQLSDNDGDFIQTFADGVVANNKQWQSWDWTQGIGLYGLIKRVERCDDPQALSAITEWFAARATEPAVAKNVNTMAPMLAATGMVARCRALQQDDSKWLNMITPWGDWARHTLPRTNEGGFQHTVIGRLNNQQLWDDTLMMTVLAYTRIGQLLNRSDYIEDAKRQFLVHARYLTDTKTGLWFHGWSFEGNHNFSRVLWGRGNSWVTMAIPDFLELLNLEKTDVTRLVLEQILSTQVAALATYQRSDGLWTTVLDDPTSYPEASCTAGFGYGILKAVRLGFIDASFITCGLNAVQAVIANILPSGELGNVSFGTPMLDTIAEYKQIPLTAMPYGQAMAMLMLEEYLLLTDAA
jgi:unsaturated rhamnogalacturonyl hydrolase